MFLTHETAIRSYERHCEVTVILVLYDSDC